MPLTSHLSRFFVVYILAIVLVVLGVHFFVTQPSGKDFSFDRLYKEAFCKDCAAETGDYGAAPELAGITNWLNSEPLTLESLRGKVVLIDFWTYSCINCIRTLPYVTQWYEKYKDDGFVIIGVHTPEFAFEKDPENVKRAIERYGITYPVAQDNDYATWQAYTNRYWPAHYLIDKDGTIVYTHFGEGNYDITENTIRQLLDKETVELEKENSSSQARTPEIYFGTGRLEHLAADQRPSSSPREYEFPETLRPDTFALGGQWQFAPESALLNSGDGGVKLRFNARVVHMVASAGEPVQATVTVDGVPVREIEISGSDLYTLFEGETAGDRTLEVMFDGPVEAFTFTFG